MNLKLEDLPGVGEATAQKLRKAGILSVEDLAALSAREIAQRVEGLSEDRAFSLAKEARRRLGIGIYTAKQYLEKRRSQPKLSTGIRSLDELLRGGLEPGITELIGGYGTGKTQLCLQLCVTAQLPPEKGGLSGKAFFIDTEHTFSPDRILAIAQRFELDGDSALENVLATYAVNTDHQMELVHEAAQYVKRENVKLIIIDSLTAHFRSEFPGRENLVARQQKLNALIHQLIRLSMIYGVVVVVTNQILDIPECFPGMKPSKPAGGNIVAHGCTFRLWLERSKDLTKITILDSPKHPRASTLVKLTEEGVVDADAS